MAQNIKVILTCDLDEEPVEAAETVTFGWNGTTFVFELCPEHLEEFGSVMTGYAEAARLERGPTRKIPKPTEDLGAMREWARVNGFEVSDRGRVSGEIREAYNSAQAAQVAPTKRSRATTKSSK